MRRYIYHTDVGPGAMRLTDDESLADATGARLDPLAATCTLLRACHCPRRKLLSHPSARATQPRGLSRAGMPLASK